VWEPTYNLLISRVLGLGQRGIEGSAAEWIVGLLVFLAAYWGLFQYAYRLHDFWQATGARRAPRPEEPGELTRPTQGPTIPTPSA
jgi:hypothetical protein